MPNSYVTVDSGTGAGLNVTSGGIWREWNHAFVAGSSGTDNYVTSGTADSGTGNEAVWVLWNSGANVFVRTASSPGAIQYVTTNRVNDGVWRVWNSTVTLPMPTGSGAGGYAAHVLPITDEERRRQEAAAAAQRQRIEAEALERKRAKKRARVLLLRHLTQEQRKALRRDGRFKVVARSGNMYVIETRAGQSRNVQQVDAEGRRIRTLCAHPADAVPDEDAFLTQKFLLENDEEAFLRVANAS